MVAEIIQGDALTALKGLPSESVQTCATSPPYWGLRKYGNWQMQIVWGNVLDFHAPRHAKKRQHHATLLKMRADRRGIVWASNQKTHICALGLEPTPELYVQHIVEIFREVKRVLRDDATCWLNFGDSYSGSGRGIGSEPDPKWKGARNDEMKHRQDWSCIGLKPKDLVGIPWMVAFALRADGWYLRSDIIWNKPNPMPESVEDRPTKSHEYIFLLSKSQTYYYDGEAIKEAANYDGRKDTVMKGSPKYADGFVPNQAPHTLAARGHERWKQDENGKHVRNKRSVWTVPTQPYSGAHFATFPPDLIKPCILAGTSSKGCCAACGAPYERIVEKQQTKEGEKYENRMERWGDDFTPPHQGGRSFQVPIRYNISQSESKTLGWQATCKCEAEVIPCTVLDPFAGSGTTGKVAIELGRRAILIELNPDYIKLIEKRCQTTIGLPLAV